MSGARSRRLLFAVLATSAVNVLLWNAAFPHFWLNSAAAMWTAVAIEITIFAVCLYALARLPYQLVLLASALLAVLTLTFVVPDHVALARTLPGQGEQPSSAHRADTPAPLAADTHFTGNVYHIVMDAFASPYMYRRISEGYSLDGFTYYPNAIANYGRTNLSMRSVYTGDYHPVPISKWNTALRRGFPAKLQEAGVTTYYFPFYSGYCDLKATACHATTDVYRSIRKNIGETFLIDILAQSVLPVSVRDYFLGSLRHETRPADTWEYGLSVTTSVAGFFDGGEGFPKWRQPIQSATIDTLEQFLEAEDSLPATGRYVFLHMMVPHAPFVYDPDCTFAHPDRQARKSMDQQTDDQFACAIAVMDRITTKLKQANRFDNSLVIFHADHGLGDATLLQRWDPNFVRDTSPSVSRDVGDLSKLPSHFVAGVSGALLLIHKPGQVTTNISDSVAQLIDIAPTALDFFGLDHKGPGVSLLSSEPPLGREPVYYEAHSADLEKVNRLAKFVRQGGMWVFGGWSKVSTLD